MVIRTVSESPSLAPLFAKAALTQRGRHGDLPDSALRREGVVVDRDHLLGYERVCGFGGGDVLPHTYPHVLGFPLQVALMADRSFPLPLPGLVHLENQITVHRQLTADDRLDLTVHAEHLRPHPKGRLVDLVTEVDVDGERVWEGRSTYLRRGRTNADADRGGQAPPLPDRPPAGVIRVPEGQGRAYAAVSGDVNPIHLHAITAKAMGFPRAIAHGMWTAARTLSALGPGTAGPSTSHVWFAKPVLLPSTVELVVDDAGPITVAGLRSAKNPTTTHLTLTLEH
ncbi:MaoC/PaaZ C-terminal domain-containing protein [Phycicoccus sp. Soil802]|uniref:MaoC/PaaZ C-terminal domain-containing protein n=1 Tax=Phycicoccus sp. Soil802 TaxID=1736414 RepID=UPI0007036AFB|nr:MaoC/PaaZ C-terminal domain-containing protein [Phycicoccus sp. Soil802]KRF29782.1 dehydratase [Phycicoccus sp. Soil802]